MFNYIVYNKHTGKVVKTYDSMPAAHRYTLNHPDCDWANSFNFEIIKKGFELDNYFNDSH